MHHFAIVALLGLALWKTVGFLVGAFGKDLTSTVRAFMTLGLGVVAAYLLDYSLFAGWGVDIRSTDMGLIFTGLIAGSMAYVWHEVLGLVEAYGRRNRDEAREIERRAPRAA